MMSRVLIFLFCYIASTVANHGRHDPTMQYQLSLNENLNREKFVEFMREHNKTYESEQERETRYMIFEKNLAKIDLLNRLEQGTAEYGVTQFADLTRREFKMLLGVRMDLKTAYNHRKKEVDFEEELGNDPIPDSWDWREHGAVTEVKDQGFCGSCWAFSVTGNIEGQNFLKKKKLISLSEQELVDCDKTDDGCGGGYMTNAYKSIMSMGGLESESDYPYAGYLSDGCVYNRTKVKVTIDSYVNLPTNETQIQQWLFKHGPISIGVNAGAMQFYKFGVSHPFKWMCRPDKIDHGVLLVGYGQEKARWSKKILPYWIIKNSWGSSYGRKGYYYLYRGDGSCGVNTMASSAWMKP